MNKTVPEMLRDCAEIYEERNRIYGDNYKKFGHVMQAMFPIGLVLKNAEDWNRLGVFIQIMSKAGRYAESWRFGHDDSLADISVYSNMLRELDGIYNGTVPESHGSAETPENADREDWKAKA